MILLDTHVWVWWVQGDPRLSKSALDFLDRQPESGTGVHVISCWEVAMLHSRKRLALPCALDDWLDQALKYPGVCFISLTRSAAVDACRLPGAFHGDPADCMLVAAANESDHSLVTADRKILEFGHVKAIHPDSLHMAAK